MHCKAPVDRPFVLHIFSMPSEGWMHRYRLDIRPAHNEERDNLRPQGSSTDPMKEMKREVVRKRDRKYNMWYCCDQQSIKNLDVISDCDTSCI